MPRKPLLTVVGSINLDLVASVEHLPRPGETVAAVAFERHPGGKGANQAVAAARLGANVSFWGLVGDDEFAKLAMAHLFEPGINLEVGQRTAAPTGIALILVDASGENQITISPGANAELGPDDVKNAAGAPAILCQLEIPLETVEYLTGETAFFCLNAAPARPLPPALVDQCALLIVNQYELDALGTTPTGLVALTLGSEGAVLLEGGREVVRAPAPRVTAIDGTAAGDAFTACLVVSFREGRDAEEALRRACAAGAIAASRFGAQPSLPTADEVDAILRG